MSTYSYADEIRDLKAHVLALTEARDHLQQEKGRAEALAQSYAMEVEELLVKVQALDAAASWQPITSAPKDQRWLLLCDDQGGPPYVGRWFIWAGHTPEDGFWQSHTIRVYPTHWQPAPPAAARREEPT